MNHCKDSNTSFFANLFFLASLFLGLNVMASPTVSQPLLAPPAVKRAYYKVKDIFLNLRSKFSAENSLCKSTVSFDIAQPLKTSFALLQPSFSSHTLKVSPEF